jgi:glycosyltransferase involved in cell wall biosynthesis
MACGVPTLASTVGVLPDLFAPEALAPPGDVAAWAQRIEKAMDADFRLRLRDLQDQRLPELTSETFLAATMEVYARALTRVERPR